MTNYILISIGIILILFGFYKGLVKKEYSFLIYSLPRERYFKETPSKKMAIVEGIVTMFIGLLLLSLGL